MSETQWFESWFDSKWYPILYSHRDYDEADRFVGNLLKTLQPETGNKFLDLACGRGRHSVFIHNHGYDVTGLDLSKASIDDAKLKEKAGLQFGVHDMRDPFEGQYDFILNLFTSFGYFEVVEDNHKVLQNVMASLLPNGVFVMDFFNIHKVVAQMVHEEEIQREGIKFGIRRSFKDGFVRKQINIEDGDVRKTFEERVQGFGLSELREMLSKNGFSIQKVWGDYNGAEYSEKESPRLIIFAGKHA